MSNLYFPICAFFLSLSLLIVFKLKVNAVNNETKLYNHLLVASFVDSVLMCLIIYIAYITPGNPILYVLNRLDYLMYLLWGWCFFLYLFNVTYSDNEKVYKHYDKICKFTGIANFIGMLLILSLKFSIYNTFDVMYAYGPAVNCVYFMCGIYVLAIVIMLLSNYKELKNKKYMPVYIFALMAVILMIVRQINPGLLLIPLILAYIDLIMFFTLENPDLKLIRELSQAKDKAEQYSNDKATFLFNITQRIRRPLTEIEELTKDIENENDIEIIKQKINNLSLATEKVQYIVKDALDISQVDAKKINIVETQYSLKKVIDEALLRLKSAVKDKEIELYTSIAEGIPPLLYGDAIKMKQILNTLFLNAAEYTAEGTIECNISCIKVRDICHIIIKVEDTGVGLPDEELNELFNKNEESKIDLDNSVVSLSTLKKVVNLTGGSLKVQSIPNKGTEYNVIIDQKIVDEELSTSDEIINKYENILREKQNVLVVTEKDKNIKNLFNAKEYDVIETKDIASALKNLNNKINIILIDEFIAKDKIKMLIQNFKEKAKKNVPIVLLCESYKPSVLDNYIAEGITECLLKPIDEKKLEETLRRQTKKN